MLRLAPLLLGSVLLVSCSSPPVSGNPMTQEDFAQQREQMVETQLESRDIQSERVLEAMKKVPRHLFMPASVRQYAYVDSPVPIGKGQTISQPYIVGLMTQTVVPKPGDRALEVGTGSGYQAAVLGELVKEVFSIEIIPVNQSELGGFPIAVGARVDGGVDRVQL